MTTGISQTLYIQWNPDITRATDTCKKCFKENSLYRSSFPYMLQFAGRRISFVLEVRYNYRCSTDCIHVSIKLQFHYSFGTQFKKQCRHQPLFVFGLILSEI